MKRASREWQDTMTDEESAEFGALETSLIHLKEAITTLSKRRHRLRNRIVMRLNWRKKHERN